MILNKKDEDINLEFKLNLLKYIVLVTSGTVKCLAVGGRGIQPKPVLRKSQLMINTEGGGERRHTVRLNKMWRDQQRSSPPGPATRPTSGPAAVPIRGRYRPDRPAVHVVDAVWSV
ncbi:unnamed protein product [Merluccius merluccius]